MGTADTEDAKRQGNSWRATQLCWLDNYTPFNLHKTQCLLWGGSRVSCCNAVSHILAKHLDENYPGPGGTMLCGAVAVPRDGWRVEEPPGRKRKAVPILPTSSLLPRSPAHAVMSRLPPCTGQGLWAQPFQVKESSRRENFASEMNVGLSIQWVYKQFVSPGSPCLHFTGSGPWAGRCFGTLWLPVGSGTTCISGRNFSAISELVLFWPRVRQLQKVLWDRNAIKTWNPKITLPPSFFSPPTLQANIHSGHGKEGRDVRRLSERAVAVKLWRTGLQQHLVWLLSSEEFNQ